MSKADKMFEDWCKADGNILKGITIQVDWFGETITISYGDSQCEDHTSHIIIDRISTNLGIIPTGNIELLSKAINEKVKELGW